MKIFKKISINLILFAFFFMNSTNVFAGTAKATNYFNTVYALMLCELGSTLTNCSNPLVIRTTPTGTTMNIGGVDAGKSAGSYGNLNVLPKGTVYTHGQVVLSRKFTVSGSDGSCKTKDGGTAGTATTFALGESGAGTSDLQVVYAANGTGMSTAMNSSAHKDETATGDSADGELDANDNYMKFRWALASPYAYDGVNMPKMTIAFDLSSGLTFNGSCGGNVAAGNGITPSAPTITNTIK